MALTRTYGSMILQDGRWQITALEPHVAIRLKQIFPRIPKAEGPPYQLPDDAAHAADLDWFLQRYPLAMDDAHSAALRRGREIFELRQAESEAILQADYVPPSRAGIRDPYILRNYQAQAVDLLQLVEGLLVVDDVGLGKTYEAAAAGLLPGALPAIVVCYPHLQGQWQSVIEKFTTLSAHIIKTTRPRALPQADFYLFRYTQLAGWSDHFQTLKPGLVVFDEIQDLRAGTKTDKGMAAARLAALCRYRLGLSATPVYNYGIEAHTIIENNLRPGELGDRSDFFREWCNGGGSINDPKAFGTYLREHKLMIRRTKKDVGQEMPEVTRIVETIEHDAEHLASIDELAHSLALQTKRGSFEERGRASRELDLLVRQETGIAKANVVADYVRMIVESGQPVVLYGWHRTVYDMWLERLKDLHPLMYTGSESVAAKNRERDAFIAGESDILIISLRSGAGLDGLQARASTVVFGELDWSPGVHHQCIGRLDREGQSEPVTAIFLVADDGSDPPMMEVLGLKASDASAITDPHLGVTSVKTDATHIQKLAARYLEKRRTTAARKTLPPPRRVIQPSLALDGGES